MEFEREGMILLKENYDKVPSGQYWVKEFSEEGRPILLVVKYKGEEIQILVKDIEYEFISDEDYVANRVALKW